METEKKKEKKEEVKLNGRLVKKLRRKLYLGEGGKPMSQEGFIATISRDLPNNPKFKKDYPEAYEYVENKHEKNSDIMSRPWLSSIENGKEPSSETMAQILAASFGVHYEELLEANVDLDESLLPVPVMLKRETILVPAERRKCPRSITLMEIVAVRASDQRAITLGYGDLKRETLSQLLDNWAGGGLEEFMEWAGIDDDDSFFFDKTSGFSIGKQSDKHPKAVVGFSGCKVRFEFSTPRSPSLPVRVEEHAWSSARHWGGKGTKP